METQKDTPVPEYRGKIDPSFLAAAVKAFDEYKGQKAQLEARITENNKWYKAQYWKTLNKNGEAEPATAFIFNAIEQKYAEAVDNYPQPVISERMPGDEQTAKLLTKILPIQLELGRFKECYKDNWRRKLKHGTAVYGVFYNEEREDIDIRVIDLLNLYCDMHIRDIQDSPFLFITSLRSNQELREEYPGHKALFCGDAQLKTYSGTYTVRDKTEVVDCYYKKRENGRTVLHLMKLAGGEVLDATEDRPDMAGGLYRHGMYPVILDVLYPEEDSPFGFGVIDVIKNPQIYIDRLDGAISKNAVIAGKIRYMIKDNGGINESEVADYSKDIIHVAGSVDDSNIRQLQANPLSEFIITHRQNKIAELKEVIGNRDFQQGGTYGGVTAAAAINSLQIAGQKVSRAVIDDSYDRFRQIVQMMIELMREFYTKERIYRIADEVGEISYETFSSEALYHPPEYDHFGFDISGGPKRAEFDVKISVQRENPITREANNQMILALWQSGMLQPDQAKAAAAVLSVMQFDGKEKLLAYLKEIQNTSASNGAAG